MRCCVKVRYFSQHLQFTIHVLVTLSTHYHCPGFVRELDLEINEEGCCAKKQTLVLKQAYKEQTNVAPLTQIE